MADALLRMGARVSLAEDQTPLGQVLMKIETPAGIELVEPAGEPAVLDVVHFVELGDGQRVCVGDMTWQTSASLTEDELREGLHELIYEDELREIEEIAGEPRWEDMLAALNALGITASEADLAGLPFTVEIEDAVRAKLKNEGPGD